MKIVMSSRTFRRLEPATDGSHITVSVRDEEGDAKAQLGSVRAEIVAKRQHRDDTAALVDRFKEYVPVLVFGVELKVM